MRKRVRMLAAALAAALLLTVPALAAETTPGVYNLKVNSGYTVQMLDESGEAAASCLAEVDGKTSTLYTGAVKFTLSFTGNAGEQYVVFLLSDADETTVPTAQNIQYIDQTAGESVTFTVYPQDMTAPGTYGVYVSSTTEAYTQVASFQVTTSWDEAPYILGDVNMDGFITSYDASVILQHIAGYITLNPTQMQAADTSKDGDVKSYDASCILQYIAGYIINF